MSRAPQLSTNLAAFLDMLAFSEGTLGKGDNGYNVLVGGKLFDSYRDHPRIRVHLPRRNAPDIYSTAAGRYQFLIRTWDGLAKPLLLPDFGPVSQDRACIALIKQCKALPLVEAGDIKLAIIACKSIWASLPGAGYGQREHKLQDLLDHYTSTGGKLK